MQHFFMNIFVIGILMVFLPFFYLKIHHCFLSSIMNSAVYC